MTCGTHTLSDCICLLPPRIGDLGMAGLRSTEEPIETGRRQSLSLIESTSDGTWPLAEIVVPKGNLIDATKYVSLNAHHLAGGILL